MEDKPQKPTENDSHGQRHQITTPPGSTTPAAPAPPQRPLAPEKCPRCDSMNTKFCYYNNYSVAQPRYFCKTCRRYWTKGGTLRNVPFGGGSRKGRRSSSRRLSSSFGGYMVDLGDVMQCNLGPPPACRPQHDGNVSTQEIFVKNYGSTAAAMAANYSAVTSSGATSLFQAPSSSVYANLGIGSGGLGISILNGGQGGGDYYGNYAGFSPHSSIPQGATSCSYYHNFPPINLPSSLLHPPTQLHPEAVDMFPMGQPTFTNSRPQPRLGSESDRLLLQPRSSHLGLGGMVNPISTFLPSSTETTNATTLGATAFISASNR